jgi:hypothetical protein
VFSPESVAGHRRQRRSAPRRQTNLREAEVFFGIEAPLAEEAGPAAIRYELTTLLKPHGKLVQAYAAFDAQFMIAPDSQPLPICGCRALYKAKGDAIVAKNALPAS